MTRETITLRDVYDIVNRLESKMDMQFDRHDERINKIEQNQSKALGVIGAITFILSGTMTYVWDRIWNPK